MKHLMSDSGIQFIVTECEFSPEQPLMLPNGRTLKTSMFERFNPFSHKRELDFIVQSPSGKNVPLGSLSDNGFDVPYMVTPGGVTVLDSAGLPIVRPDFNQTMLTAVEEDDFTKIHNIPTLESYMVPLEYNSPQRVPAFGKLLDHWIPVPFFQIKDDGQTADVPLGWCRVKISLLSEGKQTSKYRIIFAIDTTTTDDSLSRVQPWFYKNSKGEYTEPYKDYALCNVASSLMNLFFTETVDLDGESVAALSTEAGYFGQLLGVDNNDDGSDPSEAKYKHIAYYAYFLTFLRHITNLKVRLYNARLTRMKPVDVDLVLDIGNSKTCGILFENGDFTKREMLTLRDLTEPWKEYDKSFDMRVVFRQAFFGDSVGREEDKPLFQWRSLLRVGQEASNLMHNSIEDEGLYKKSTNYSSPKRYLWDLEPYDGSWEYLHTQNDSMSVRSIKTMYMDGLTSFINEDGTLSEKRLFRTPDGCHYSRSSLMTLTFLEIFRHAENQINTEKFREKMGDIDRPRRLRNIIITAPTAMPNSEQVRLRQFAHDAYTLMCKDGVNRSPITIVPAPANIVSRPKYDIDAVRDWCYDEATACQLVYLYAEVQERYAGEAHTLFNLKGRPRKDMNEKGFEGNVLTVGSIDIGAGTTDLMICSYGIKNGGRIFPMPLFWDSFYLAGDDIMRSLVQNVILEGGLRGDTRCGTIASVLQARLNKLSDEEFRHRLSATETDGQRIDLENILRATSDEARAIAIEKYGQDLMFDYFGGDSANNSYRDRRCRMDFNSQISVPLASYMLQMLSTDMPQRDITFEEVFGACPPANYILEHFNKHFGFPFEEIMWEYRPEKVAGVITKVMTPLMEQLSIILHAWNVDIVMLAGRPTKLSVLTDLFLKFFPVSPSRLIRLPEYEVGNWYPFSHGTGEITDQKTIVAVGAYIGYLASHGGIKNFNLDFKHLATEMGATANYIGKYRARIHRVDPTLLEPTKSSANFRVESFPFYFGCKQLNTGTYESRPLYAMEWIGDGPAPQEMTVMVSRSFLDNKEKLTVEDAYDDQGHNYKQYIKLKEQSLVDSENGDGNCWLDDGAFKYLKK